MRCERSIFFHCLHAISRRFENFKLNGKYNPSNSPFSLELHYHLIKKNRQIKRSSKKCATVLRQPSLYLIYSVVAANSKKNAVVYIYIALCIDTVYTQECVMLQTKKLKSTTPIIVSVSFPRRLSQSLLLSFRANSRRTHTCTCIHSHTGRLAGKQQYALFIMPSLRLHSIRVYQQITN